MSGHPKEEVAHEAANELLMDAMYAATSIANENGDLLAYPELVAAHMLVSKLDSIETSLLDAARDLDERLDHMTESIVSSNTELADARKLVAYLKSMEPTQPEVIRELRAHIGLVGIDPKPVPSRHESELIYRALEEDYLRNHQAATIGEMDAALQRFKRLSGL